MRPTLDQLNAMFDDFNQRYFEGKITKVPVVINERLRSVAGRAHCKRKWVTKKVLIGLRTIDQRVPIYIPNRIEISGRIFDHNGWDYRKKDWPMTELEDTLAHEMTHLYLMEHFDDRGHSQHFHNIMSRITGVYGNHRCHTMARAPKKSAVTARKKGGVIGGIGLKIK
jgi:hypothetical protein